MYLGGVVLRSIKGRRMGNDVASVRDTSLKHLLAFILSIEGQWPCVLWLSSLTSNAKCG